MKIHMVAICGTGMGSLAGLLQEAGHQVRGSDKAFYPPMSERLEAWGIETLPGFDPAHIAPDTDLVVVGNACRRDNPEARAALDAKRTVKSFPQTLSELFLEGKRSVMVAGTHGKTTTTSLLAYLLIQAGRDPGFLVGGVPLNFGRSFRLGRGGEFVIEGDEYDSAFFDKRPKFVHYRPELVVLTSVEFDHADIYPDMDAYRASFQSLVGMLPAQGLLAAYAEDPEVRALLPTAACQVVTYGFSQQATWRASALEFEGGNSRFVLSRPDAADETLEVPLAGRHNVANCLGALVIAKHLGIGPAEAVGHLAGFSGIARRMQVRGVEAEVTVVDDFAHHPTEVFETVRAARDRWPLAQLVAVFEPRTNTSRRRFFQQRYPLSFDGADRIVIVPPFDTGQIPIQERFDSTALVEALRSRGRDAILMSDADEVVDALAGQLQAGAVVLVMSNGAFGGIHDKLLAALRARTG
jgi:UDP-N-acetylmuramate: L-alanyl-gamma-D-glutamyl-meso-diaminopimelate ligase